MGVVIGAVVVVVFDAVAVVAGALGLAATVVAVWLGFTAAAVVTVLEVLTSCERKENWYVIKTKLGLGYFEGL